ITKSSREGMPERPLLRIVHGWQPASTPISVGSSDCEVKATVRLTLDSEEEGFLRGDACFQSVSRQRLFRKSLSMEQLTDHAQVHEDVLACELLDAGR